MGRWLRTWYKKFHAWAFGAEWQGASEDWSPVHSTTRAGDSGAFFEIELLRSFDRIVETLKAEPKWLTDFKAKTELMQSKIEWDRKYSQLSVDTSVSLYKVQELEALLAIA